MLTTLALSLVPALPGPEVLPFSAGRFDKPGKDAARLELSGGAELVRGEGGAHLELGEGRLVARVTVPAAPAPEKVPSGGWFGLVTIDDAGTEGQGSLDLAAYAAEGSVPLVKETFATEQVSDRGRVRVLIPAADFAPLAGSSLRLELSGRGPVQLRLDDLTVQRFHVAPTKKLVGKANGKLGPDLLGIGAFGFTGLTEHHGNAFSILDVGKEGPAARAGLKKGDVVVDLEGEPLPSSSIAPGWEWFRESHEAMFGRAIESALFEGRREVKVTVLRPDAGGATFETLELSLEVPFTTAPGERFPLAGTLAGELRADLIGWTARNQKEDGSWPGTGAVNPAMAGLALLGTHDPRYAEQIRRCVDWILARNPKPSEMKGLAFWTIAFHGMFLAEYHLASGDERVLPWITEALEWLPSTTHESKWGMQGFGHGPDGLPYGNKGLMAPCAHLLVFDALGRRCGVDSKVWEHIEPYVVHSWSDPDKEGHGGMGYNASYKDKGEFWSRTGLVALAAALRGDTGRMHLPLCLFMGERHPWMLNSHAYGEPGAALGLVSLAVAHRPTFEEILPQWKWRFLAAWEPGFGLRYSTPHMGAPYMGGEAIINPSYALLMAVENRGLVMTGGEPERWLDDGFEVLLEPGTLDGWHALPGGAWDWRGDVLVGTSPKEEQRHGLLVTDERFGDFEARLEFRTLSGCSGFYFRVEENGGGTGVSGFQAEVDPSYETGGLYETGGRGWVVRTDPELVKAIYTPGDWTRMSVRALGGDVEVRVNGVLTAGLEDDPGRREGHLGLQLHGSQDLQVEFRNLRLRRL